MVFESSVKQSLGCQFGLAVINLLWQEIQEPLAQGANVLGVKLFGVQSLYLYLDINGKVSDS